MPIFGQVWLWSLLAFLLGAVLCWVLVVLPVRRRIEALESRLSSLRNETKLSAAAERSRAGDRADLVASPQGIVPGFGDAGGHDEVPAESLTRAYALPGVKDVPSTPYGEPAEERGALRLSSGTEPAGERPAGATQYIGNAGEAQPGGRDWFDDQPEEPAAPADRRLVDDEEDEDRGTIFTQRTTPIPAGLIRRLDESGPRPEDSLVDDMGDEPEVPVAHEGAHAKPETVATNGAALTRPEPPAPAEPEPEPDEQADVPAPVEHQAPVAELPTRTELPTRGATPEPKLLQGLTVEADRAPSALPKRIPSKPQHRHPFGVATVSPAVSTPAPASTSTSASAGSERMRSLFEPIIPAEGGQSAVPPPPHRLPAATPAPAATPSAPSPAASSRPSSPGPFGPGSAMPLPGGASPSPEFTVKASVTALRYCTPESPQFGRTVAEVWFRSAADAERVGFRPVG